MKTIEVLHAWSRILAGRRPSLSIEITKECPLHCPLGGQAKAAIRGHLKTGHRRSLRH